MAPPLLPPDRRLASAPAADAGRPGFAGPRAPLPTVPAFSRIQESPVKNGKFSRLPVLLVLDDDEQTHSTVEMSSGDFARILHAADPLEAFRWLREETIDVVVSSSTIGHMDLTHLLCLAKRRHPGMASIVIGSGGSPLLSRLTRQGDISCYLARPLKVGALRASIKAALSTSLRPASATDHMPPQRNDAASQPGWLGTLLGWFKA